MQDVSRGEDMARVGVLMHPVDTLRWKMDWLCEQWSEEACEFARRALYMEDDAPVSCLDFEKLKIVPENVVEVAGNLLLNEGIQRLLDLLIGAGGTAYNNANAGIGVGDTNTAAAATQTELQATQNAANRFYKGMVASYPQRTNQTVDWRSDFTTSEANFAWAEWSITAGMTTASGSGFLIGTINLNRKVESLGTKTTGTWTLTGSVTIS